MPGYGIRPPDAGAGLLPWSWAEERLSRSHHFLAGHGRGRRSSPRHAGVGGVVRGRRLVVQQRVALPRARNLADPRCTLTTDDALEPVIVEGDAERVLDQDRLAAFMAALDAKYETDYGASSPTRPSTACGRWRRPGPSGWWRTTSPARRPAGPSAEARGGAARATRALRPPAGSRRRASRPGPGRPAPGGATTARAQQRPQQDGPATAPPPGRRCARRWRCRGGRKADSRLIAIEARSRSRTGRCPGNTEATKAAPMSPNTAPEAPVTESGERTSTRNDPPSSDST